MIRRWQKQLNAINVLTDGAAVFLAMLAAYFVRFYIFTGRDGPQEIGPYLLWGLGAAALFVLLYAVAGLYGSQRARRFLGELERLIAAGAAGVALLLSALFVLREVDVSRWAMALFYLFATGFAAAKRYALRRALRAFRARGRNLRHVLLVGCGDAASEYCRVVRESPWFGYSISGCVTDGEPPRGLAALGALDALPETLERGRFDEVVAAPDIGESARIPYIISACDACGVRLSLIPFFASDMTSRPQVDEIGGLPLINLRRVPLDDRVAALFKRVFDIVCAAALLAVTSPLTLFAAVGTRLSSSGPVIFRQTRVGLGARRFTMYKFRTLREGESSDVAWSTASDPRRTRFGAFLRKLSIDELPQLLNVLRGDMSLVGPRPELPHFVELFRREIPLYMVKHQVRPGMTGWAQINGLRGDTSVPERIRHDLWYIENWSPLLDIKILLLTPFRGVVNSESMGGGTEHGE